ncbi:hypothetical protein AB1Y20_011204 [Prymnesium parvum]|uniref:Receptor ligand binding region domain-containing protein n=1 Tax=Prymnesium parvum TaxID=97485 RepID=A0AB34ILX1_PRYPA
MRLAWLLFTLASGNCAVPEVRIGALFPIFKGRWDNYAKDISGVRRFATFLLAIKEINNKTDGIADDLLPNTQIKFTWRDSKRADWAAVIGAFELTRDAFGGQGVHAIVGAASSGPSSTAALISGQAQVPQISYSSTSALLSDGKAYSYFLRTPPSDAFQGELLADTVKNQFGFTRVATVASSDAYGSAGISAFHAAAQTLGIEVLTQQSFVRDSLNFDEQIRQLYSSRTKITILFCQASDAGKLMVAAYQQNYGGPGYVWIGSDAVTKEDTWLNGGVMLNETLRLSVMKGFFGCLPSGGQDLPQFAPFAARLRDFAFSSPPCNLETDDDGRLIWAQDHDDNPATQLECVAFDGVLDSYAPYAYDATFALAHALHVLIEKEGRSSIEGPEFLLTLLRNVSFEGVTGTVNFYDATSDPDLRFNGDRRVGIKYDVFNYVGVEEGLVHVATWASLEQSSFEQRWTWVNGFSSESLVWSTDDNSVFTELRPLTCEQGYGLSVIDSLAQCVICEEGYFSATRDSAACRQCPLGSYQLRPGQTSCVDCSQGTYQLELGALCQDCPTGTSSLPRSSTCEVCAPGYFLEPGYTASSASCNPCPKGAVCGWNTTLATLGVQRGFWRLSPLTSTVYECQGEKALNLTNATACKGGQSGDDVCAPGHSGPLCQVCLRENQYFNDGFCEECPTPGAELVVIVMLIFVASVFVGTLFFLHAQQHPKYDRFSVPLRKLVHYTLTWLKSLGLVPKLKLALSFAQIVAALDNTYAVGMPDSWFQWTSFLRALGDVDWMSWVIPSSCVIGSRLVPRLLLRGIAPFVVIIAIPLLGASYAFFHAYVTNRHGRRRNQAGGKIRVAGTGTRFNLRCSKRKPTEIAGKAAMCGGADDEDSAGQKKVLTKRRVSARLERHTRWLSSSMFDMLEDSAVFIREDGVAHAITWLPIPLVLTFCFTPSVSATVFRAWHCLSYAYDDSNGAEYSYLAQDLSVRCDDSEEHNEILLVAWILVAIWPIGMVVLYASLLLPSRWLLLEQKSESTLVRATAFLHRDYKPSYFWWEVVALVQRTTLTGWLLLIDVNLRLIRLFAAVIISLGFLVVLLLCNPYKRKFDFGMAAGCQLLFICIFIGGIIIRLFADIQEKADDPELASRVLGIDSSEGAVALMIVIAFAMIMLLFATLSFEVYMQVTFQRLMSKWSVCTMEPPYVKWKLRGIYACFLSHYKQEAASDARYMHDMLRKMLRSPVFLDSSSLSDLRELITDGVHKSDVLVLLATKGVLSRPWCLLELLETVRKRIPVVIVQLRNGGFDYEQAHAFSDDLVNALSKVNPEGLDFLQQRLGDPKLTELKLAISRILNISQRMEPLLFDSYAGDNVMLAVMKDVVERMADARGITVEWSEEPKSFAQKSVKDEKSKRKTFSVADPGSDEVINTEAAIYLSCARVDAVVNARAFRSELEMKLGRGCAVGGSEAAASLISSCDMMVVMLTKKLLSNPIALYEIWTAINLQKPIVPVLISGAGYDFNEASTAFENLSTYLDDDCDGNTEELQNLVNSQESVDTVGRRIQAVLTSIIALSWSPLATQNQRDAMVEDVIARMPPKVKQRKSKAQNKRVSERMSRVAAPERTSQLRQESSGHFPVVLDV